MFLPCALRSVFRILLRSVLLILLIHVVKLTLKIITFLIAARPFRLWLLVLRLSGLDGVHATLRNLTSRTCPINLL